jgi:RRXRR protein
LAVFVLDKRKKPLTRCWEKRARLLLTRGRAVVRRLKDRIGGEVRPGRVKLDPASKTTGIAGVTEEDSNKPSMCRIDRLRRWAPLSAIPTELGHFDGQALANPEISGVEVREYVFEKFGHHCGCCGAVDAPLSLDRIVPRSRGGSNRVSHLVPSSSAGNQYSKEALSIEELLAHDPKRLAAIQAQLKALLQDAAAINATRWALCGALRATTGRGFYGRTKLDKYGFPRGHCIHTRSVRALKAGDMVRAEVPIRKGVHVGRAAVRESGSFSIGKAQHRNCKHCRMLHRADLYGFAASASPAPSFGRTDFNCRLLPTLAIRRG